MSPVFTDRVFDYEWREDFGSARNFSFSKATQDFILWLDADDVIEEADRERFKALKPSLTDRCDRITMPYLLSLDHNGNPTSSLRRNRLVRRVCHFQWIGAVHEYLNASGPCLDSDVCVTHRKVKAYTDRNLRMYENRLEAGEIFSVRDLYYFANELRDHRRYAEAIVFYDRMLRSNEGWVEDNIQACLNMSDCCMKLGDKEQQFLSLARALKYEKPGPEVLFAFGNYFFEEQRYTLAIHWYEQATVAERRATMGLTNRASSTWLPHLQLCLCYDRLRQYDKAYAHNEMAAVYNPSHPSVVYNRQYFRSVHKLGDATGTEGISS